MCAAESMSCTTERRVLAHGACELAWCKRPGPKVVTLASLGALATNAAVQ